MNGSASCLPAHAGEERASHETEMDSLKAEFATSEICSGPIQVQQEILGRASERASERADYLLSRSEVPALAQ
jgi:hypothetical protein